MLTEKDCLARYGIPRLPSCPRERIAITRPWEKSTGPKTEQGKLMCSKNRLRHGLYTKNFLLAHVARVRLEELAMQQLNAELLPLIDFVDTRIPGFKDILQELLKQQEEQDA